MSLKVNSALWGSEEHGNNLLDNLSWAKKTPQNSKTILYYLVSHTTDEELTHLERLLVLTQYSWVTTASSPVMPYKLQGQEYLT